MMKFARNIIILPILFLSSCSCYEFASSLQSNVKPDQYSGIVLYKFSDQMDRGTPKVVLKYTDTIGVYAYECWDDIRIGDSLSKPKGSLQYSLFRNNQKIGSYYPKCGNKEIK